MAWGRLRQTWRQYKYRFVPWIAYNLKNRSVRSVPRGSCDKLVSDEEVCQALTSLFSSFLHSQTLTPTNNSEEANRLREAQQEEAHRLIGAHRLREAQQEETQRLREAQLEEAFRLREVHRLREAQPEETPKLREAQQEEAHRSSEIQLKEAQQGYAELQEAHRLREAQRGEAQQEEAQLNEVPSQIQLQEAHRGEAELPLKDSRRLREAPLKEAQREEAQPSQASLEEAQREEAQPSQASLEEAHLNEARPLSGEAAWMSQLEAQRGDGRRASINLSIMESVMGFSVQRAVSRVPDGGRGVVVSRGTVPPGTVVAMYPGTVYLPYDPVLLQSLGNPFIFRCIDRLLIDGNDRRVSKFIFRSCTQRDRVGPYFTSDMSWLSDHPTNPLAVGQYVNNHNKDFPANVAYQEWDVPADFPFHLRRYVPNVFYSPNTGWGEEQQDTRLMRVVVLVSTRHISEGEELFSSYFTVIH